MLLHRRTDVVGDVLRVFARAGIVELRQTRQREISGIGRERLVILDLFHVLDDVVAGRAAEHHQVEQRVRAQTVRAVHRHARAFAHRVETVDRVFVALRGAHDLTVDVRRNAAHLVVDGRHDGDRLLDAVDVRELQRDFADRRQTLHDRLGADVRQVEQHVVLVRTDAAAFLDFLVHRARDEVARRQILQRRCIALHEALAVRVAQNAALAAHAFRDQHAGTGDARRVELPEFHVFERDACACSHAEAVARVDERIGRRREDPARAARGEQRGLAFEDVDVARFHFERGHAEHVAFGVADQVQRHPFDEERGLRRDVLLVQRVQQCVARTVSGSARALDRLLAVVRRVAAERALVDRAVRVTVERHAEVFQFVDGVRRFAAHELDRVLVAEPVGALDRVVEVVVPVVFAHVAERGADAALCGDGVRTRREHLREHAHGEARARELQRGAHPGAARADDDHIELATRQRILDCNHSFTLSRESAQRSPHTRAARRSSAPAAEAACPRA
ncbi:hypothetical protein LMG24235_08715 [Paraburkholderia sabiae]|nr:hypothetical protein LMG24235_08715 [Paraburkholderia sabiae]